MNAATGYGYDSFWHYCGNNPVSLRYEGAQDGTIWVYAYRRWRMIYQIWCTEGATPTNLDLIRKKMRFASGSQLGQQLILLRAHIIED